MNLKLGSTKLYSENLLSIMVNWIVQFGYILRVQVVLANAQNPSHSAISRGVCACVCVLYTMWKHSGF